LFRDQSTAIEKIKVLLHFLECKIISFFSTVNFIWHKYAVVAIVGHDNNGKKEPWLTIISNKAPLSFVYEKLSPAIYLEQLTKRNLTNGNL
jgi:hypothetical protein